MAKGKLGEDTSVDEVWGAVRGGCCDVMVVSMAEVACEGIRVGAVAVD